MRENNIPAWNPLTGKGLIRRLIVRTSFAAGEVMAIVVINGKELPGAEKLARLMDEYVSAADTVFTAGGRYWETPGGTRKYSLKSLALNLNKEASSKILGDRWVTLAGKSAIADRVGGLAAEISPGAFYQVNPVQMEKLYDKALEYARLTGNETVLDLYCGVGTIGLYMAGRARRVIGIEADWGAIADANRNAIINGVVNAEFVRGKTEDALPALLSGVYTGLSHPFNTGDGIDVIVLDPPRAGCAPETLAAAASASPERVVYVSCDAATLARDVKYLCSKGFAFVEATPVDMFPHTPIIETVALLRR
jgi:23S rRNA (uracil1939-C5)-methyltransferase